MLYFFFFQAEDGIRDYKVTGVQTCALPIYRLAERDRGRPRLRRGLDTRDPGPGPRGAPGCPAGAARSGRGRAAHPCRPLSQLVPAPAAAVCRTTGLLRSPGLHARAGPDGRGAARSHPGVRGEPTRCLGLRRAAGRALRAHHGRHAEIARSAATTATIGPRTRGGLALIHAVFLALLDGDEPVKIAGGGITNGPSDHRVYRCAVR